MIIAGEIMTGSARPELSRSSEVQNYQGNWERLSAMIIDSILLGLIIGISDIILSVTMDQAQLPWWNISRWEGPFNFLLYLAYFTYMEGSRGQTIGKKAVKIRVVREDGGEINMSQALKRNILRVIDGLMGYLVGAFFIWRSDKKQRLGDMWAKTVVVKDLNPSNRLR